MQPTKRRQYLRVDVRWGVQLTASQPLANRDPGPGADQRFRRGGGGRGGSGAIGTARTFPDFGVLRCPRDVIADPADPHKQKVAS